MWCFGDEKTLYIDCMEKIEKYLKNCKKVIDKAWCYMYNHKCAVKNRANTHW